MSSNHKEGPKRIGRNRLSTSSLRRYGEAINQGLIVKMASNAQPFAADAHLHHPAKASMFGPNFDISRKRVEIVDMSRKAMVGQKKRARPSDVFCWNSFPAQGRQHPRPSEVDLSLCGERTAMPSACQSMEITEWHRTGQVSGQVTGQVNPPPPSDRSSHGASRKTTSHPPSLKPEHRTLNTPPRP